jgi:iron(III) transport system ATP-binding protein
MQALEVRNLVKKYPGRQGIVAIDDVSITVEEGAMLVLLGPSGCGKTTLLRCIAGLEDSQQGSIAFGGRTVFDAAKNYNMPTYQRDIGLVFQNYSLWPHMTVARNVEYPLRARGVPKAEIAPRRSSMLDIVQCGHLSERYPAMLSGGQQQRIALARALVSEPSVMLLDEPLSNLDALLRVELRAQLREIHSRLGFTGIYVTHDQSEALSLGSRVAVMRTGKVEQLGTPQEVYERPVSEYVANFLGIRNSIAIRHSDGWATPAGPLAGDLAMLDTGRNDMKLYVRPEHIRLQAAGAPLAAGRLAIPGARIADAVYAGSTTEFVLAIGEATFIASIPAEEAGGHKRDDVVDIVIDHRRALVYSQDRLV